ncbi:ribokinase [Thermomonas paludicola]|uniref:ribokinase n=1 Tax=Thermomonas paludicola TaxID=2884874 RepID=UPI00211481D7|nr:ribokinase [Thermomonas paludicola]
MSTARVFVAGSFNVDHVWRVATLPVAGATLGGDYAFGPGGKGFNQAIAARRAGADTRFVCALGDDPAAQLARTLCANDGIDLQATIAQVPTGTAGIYVDAAGRNCIVIGSGANAALQADAVARSLQGIGTGDVVLAQLESPLDTVAQALQTGRAAGAIAMLNPAPANAAIDRAMLGRVDILTPNETEFSALLVRHVGERIDADLVSGIDQQRLHALCRELVPDGTVIITLGSSGCFVSHADATLRGDTQACYRISAESAQVVDTTGAGDAFNGALAASLAQLPDAAFIEHVRFANRYAAHSTEQAGAALAMPYLAAL